MNSNRYYLKLHPDDNVLVLLGSVSGKALIGADIGRGEYAHLHNIQSDYISTYALEGVHHYES